MFRDLSGRGHFFAPSVWQCLVVFIPPILIPSTQGERIHDIIPPPQNGLNQAAIPSSQNTADTALSPMLRMGPTW